MRIRSMISRGRHAGATLVPHRREDGAWVASLTRFERDHILLHDEGSVLNALKSDLGLRMCNEALRTPPSLISPGSILVDGEPEGPILRDEARP